MNRRTRIVSLLAGLVLLASAAPASAKKLSADKIVDEMLERDPLGYGGAEAHIAMALVNSRGQTQKRKMVMFSRKDKDTRRLFVRFLAPSDIMGTAFLGIDDDGDRTQYLYMPASNKTRRISSKQRNGSFVGTDYSYADLDNRDIDDSKKSLLPDDKVGKQACYVVEAKPTSGESKYGRVVLWISKTTFLPLRIRFYNRHGDEIKRLTVQEVKKVESRWIIAESKMVDLKREHTTVFKVVEIDLKDDIPLEQFTPRALERG